MEWDEYHGSHDYESLSEFAKKSISKLICSARVPENCDKAELAVLQSLDSKSTEELDAIYEQAQAKMGVLHEEFQAKEAKILENQRIQVKLFAEILDEAAGEYDYKMLMQMMEQRVQKAAREEATEGKVENRKAGWGV
jgi:hypothetical protein